MSAPINTGGPAFPFQESNADGTHYHSHNGMNLRDYFAAKYMQGYMANADTVFPTRDVAASEAYKMADAMLKARDA